MGIREPGRSPDLPLEDLLRRLDLVPHPVEGGYFRETYRSAQALPAGDRSIRSLATAIYYLLVPETVSALHRLRGDEIFHFYLGDPVEMLQLHPGGAGTIHRLGTDLAQGMRPQVVVPGGVWQGARLIAGGRYALLGTTMAPGFDPADYEHGEGAALAAAHPEFAEMIRGLARPPS